MGIIVTIKHILSHIYIDRQTQTVKTEDFLNSGTDVTIDKSAQK